MYLAFALNKVVDRGSSLGRWDPTPTQSGIINTFSRQALPMTFQFRRARTRCSCIVSFPVNAAGVNWGVEELDGKWLVALASVYSGQTFSEALFFERMGQ